jgi:hypothetical protein
MYVMQSERAPSMPAGGTSIVVGAGPVGVRVAQEIRRRLPDRPLVVFGAETWQPYNRIRLSSALAGELSWSQLGTDLRLPEDALTQVHLGCAVARIDRSARTVTDAQGGVHLYAELILATGSRPHVPDIPGADRSGVLTFRAAAALQRLLARRGLPWEEAAAKTLETVLTRLCARYLLREEAPGRPGRARDPVAHFHLSNGARVERLNWRADISENGMRQAAGMMVNYLYDPARIEENHELYVGEGRRAAFDFPPVNRDRGYGVIEAMRPIAEARGASVAQIALAWLLHQSVVTSVIVGAKRPDQLADNLAAVDVRLSADELAALDAASALPSEYPGWMLERQGAYRAHMAETA